MTTEERISTLERVLVSYVEKYGLSDEARAYFVEAGSTNIIGNTGFFQKLVEN